MIRKIQFQRLNWYQQKDRGQFTSFFKLVVRNCNATVLRSCLLRSSTPAILSTTLKQLILQGNLHQEHHIVRGWMLKTNDQLQKDCKNEFLAFWYHVHPMSRMTVSATFFWDAPVYKWKLKRTYNCFLTLQESRIIRPPKLIFQREVLKEGMQQ